MSLLQRVGAGRGQSAAAPAQGGQGGGQEGVVTQDFARRAATFEQANTHARERLQGNGVVAQQQSILNSLFRDYRSLDSAYAQAATRLRDRAQIDFEHAKALKLALEIFPRAEEVIASGEVHGLRNAGGNCPFNALLQMLFSAPSLIDALMRAPELTELRTAYLQYTGVLQGQISTQAMRRELHALNPAISPNAFRWEDAHEVLSTMLRYVPGEVAEARFPATDVVRYFNPNPSRSEDFVVLQDHAASRLYQIDRPGEGIVAYTHPRQEAHSPFLLLDPVAAVNGIAPFADVLANVFDADSTADNEVGFVNDGDNMHRHFHQPLRTQRSYPTTPEHLIINTRRFHYDAEHDTVQPNDTPMQMPRVLTLPAGSVEDHGPGRLLLRSFVVYKPGHYVAYVRRGQNWFYCSDSTTRRVPLAEVDKALCYTPRGGSYLHYYERAEAEVLDVEPAMTAYDPRADLERQQQLQLDLQREARLVPTEQTKIAESLFWALNRPRIDLRECFGLFNKLKPETQYRCYDLLFRDQIVQAGINQFLQNPRSILPLLEQLQSTPAKALKACLEQQGDVLNAANQLFLQLNADEQLRCYEQLCRRQIVEQGIEAFLANPSALLKQVKVGTRTDAIINHLISATKVERAPAPSAAVPRFQRQVYDALVYAVERRDQNETLRYWNMLQEKYRRAIGEYAAQQKQLNGDNLAEQGLALFGKDLKKDPALFASSLMAAMLAMNADLPYIPRDAEINAILQQAFRGQAYDAEAFDALITRDHVNDYWPQLSGGRRGSILRFIATQGGIVNGEHLRPLLEKLAKKGLDFTVSSPAERPAWLLALEQGNYDVAMVILEVAFAHVPGFDLQDFGTEAVQLMARLGYRTYLAPGAQGPDPKANGTALLRLLLTHCPQSVNTAAGRMRLSPLHLAALRRDVEFCRIFREFRANPKAKNQQDQTPLDMLKISPPESMDLLRTVEGISSLVFEGFPQKEEAIRELFREETPYDVAIALAHALHEKRSRDEIYGIYSKLGPQARAFLTARLKSVGTKVDSIDNLRNNQGVITALIEKMLSDDQFDKRSANDELADLPAELRALIGRASQARGTTRQPQRQERLERKSARRQ